MSDFYEEKLKQAGVRLEKNVTAERLWGLEEQARTPGAWQTQQSATIIVDICYRGEFDTLGGRRVHFGPAPRGFTECRGVVLRNTEDCLIHVPARTVIIGIGAVPNSELFRGKLEMSEVGTGDGRLDGGILVDSQCRTAVQPPSEDGGGGGIDVGSAAPPRPIYAAGDVAAFPLALEGFAAVRYEHIQNARDMAICAAKNMVGSSAWGSLVSSAGEAGFQKDYYGGGELPTYQPVPGFSSRFLGLSWRLEFGSLSEAMLSTTFHRYPGIFNFPYIARHSLPFGVFPLHHGTLTRRFLRLRVPGRKLPRRFYGVAEGEVVVLGAAEFRTTRTFGAFWVRKERVVGAFLEGGTIEQQIAVAQAFAAKP
ncbi:MDHAR [Ectocarpus sp. CCAP 1310/34]|nr:MDHAR [Ectocarpus sp. CCAP 1310/34]